MEQFFGENAKNPTAYSTGIGAYIRFSISSDIYHRDETRIKKLVSKYNLIMTKGKNMVSFTSKSVLPSKTLESNLEGIKVS